MFKETSKKCKEYLVAEVLALGGTPDTGTRTTGKFYRAWMDIKAALTGGNRKTILNSCEFGEDVAVEAYENVLQDNVQDLTDSQITALNSQYQLIKADHDEIKALRNMVSSL